MKKIITLLSILFLLIMVSCSVLSGDLETVFLQVDANNNLTLLIDTGLEQEELQPWYDSSAGIYFFFLPSFCENNHICVNETGKSSIFWNGLRLQEGSSITYAEEEAYTIHITDDTENTTSYQIQLLRSEHLPAVFIDTASGSMDYIHEEQGNSETGTIKIVKSDGKIEYNGSLDKLSGRGNTTWRYAKKPYSIKLSEKASLLGMDAGKKWVLLAGWRESAKLNTRLAFDMAEEIGLAYTPHCEWIDLYLNGEYAGIYYLTESVSIGEGRVEIADLDKTNKLFNPVIEAANLYEDDSMKGYIINNGENISGGYLIEKDFSRYWKKSDTRFVTLSGNKFSIKEPGYASVEQIQYISDYIQQIDTMITDGNPDFERYIDLNSFAGKFVIDEIAVNLDMGVTSMYFYKEKDNNLLYAGPVWDFDNSFGEYNSNSADGQWVDYTISIVDPPRTDKEEILYWNAYLYENEIFRNAVINKYKDLLPYIRLLLEEKIDTYVSRISKSVYLDKIRWDCEHLDDNYYVGHYKNFENNVRYIKYYLSNRVNFLNERWAISAEDILLNEDSENHKVTFMAGDEILEILTVPDGETPDKLPHLDTSKYSGWFYEHNNEEVRSQIPVLEDCIIYAK